MDTNEKISFSGIWQSLQETYQNPVYSVYISTVGFFVGLCAGCICCVFRIFKGHIFHFVLRWMETFAHSPMIIAYFIFAFLAALIVGYEIKNKAIRYGGAQWIRDALNDGQTRPWAKILIPKFIGSTLVLGSGISVGSEGPSIEMGAATALGLKTFDKKEIIERRYFILGGCAAGLAAAFSAPFAGIFYVSEIMREKMDRPLFIFLIAGSFGVYVAVELIFGLDVLLQLGHTPHLDLWHIWLLAPLGVFAGMAGVTYAYLMRLSIALYGRQNLIPQRYRPILAFMSAGIIMMVFPAISGEGMRIFKSFPEWYLLSGFLSLFVVAKIFYTSFCYGTGIPAGTMVPILCIGGAMGGIYADWAYMLQLLPGGYDATFVLLGMAAAFTTSECAPITALVLVCQMTGSFDLALPMIFVTSIAWLVSRYARVKAP